MKPISAEASRGYSHLTLELPKGPSHPCCNSRSSPTYCLHLGGSTRVPPTSRGAPFPPPNSRGGILSLRGRDRIPGVPVHLKSRRSPQERREELQGRATIPRVPQMSQYIPGKTFFPALPRPSSRGSTHTTVHVGQPCGKASWKASWKASRESP